MHSKVALGLQIDKQFKSKLKSSHAINIYYFISII
jgi:hypothetical protein